MIPKLAASRFPDRQAQRCMNHGPAPSLRPATTTSAAIGNELSCEPRPVAAFGGAPSTWLSMASSTVDVPRLPSRLPVRTVAALGVLAVMACAAAPAPAPLPATPAPATPPTPIRLATARAQFAEASERCTADHGTLWGISLCGPLMVVDGKTRFVVANQRDAQGLLQAQAGVFVGSLPGNENIANTAVTWGGVHWVQLVWPLPAERGARDVLMMHEMFHRIAEQLGLRSPALDNGHLATADGRYYLQLEWRALAAALRATTEDQRRAAVADALAFRRARRDRFPGSATTEDALELNEGLAEYTGVVAGNPDAARRTAAALHDLDAHVADPSFVRSFAYATGPSYGLLLDRYTPAWRKAIAQTRSLSGMLASAVSARSDPAHAAVSYGGPALLAAEQARAVELAGRLAAYRRALVERPVLTLRFCHMKIQFDPRNVESLGELGSAYPTLRIVDDWGVLQVTGGALVKADWKSVVVPAPAMTTGRSLTGSGWSLELAAGASLEPDQRAGDFRLAHACE